MIVDATLAAATQLRVLVRAVGVEGVPGVRIRHSLSRGPEEFELVVEDRRLSGDEVYESRGIRFYLDGDTARQLGPVRIDLSGREFVLERVTEAPN